MFKIYSSYFYFALIVSLSGCKQGREVSHTSDNKSKNVDTVTLKEDRDEHSTEDLEAKHKVDPIEIDGYNNEKTWTQMQWNSMNYVWMGEQPKDLDYSGRFKASWDTEKLYLLVEVRDDFLNPTLSDGKENYWKGDYVEVFIDADRSGGDHKTSHQAFAYHVTTEGHAIDLDNQGNMIYFDDHIEVSRTIKNNVYTWEMAINLFDKNFDEHSDENVPINLSAGRIIGFSIAYGDNDGNDKRENFMGSKHSHGVNNDQGYTNASVFGGLQLVD